MTTTHPHSHYLQNVPRQSLGRAHAFPGNLIGVPHLDSPRLINRNVYVGLPFRRQRCNHYQPQEEVLPMSLTQAALISPISRGTHIRSFSRTETKTEATKSKMVRVHTKLPHSGSLIHLHRSLQRAYIQKRR